MPNITLNTTSGSLEILRDNFSEFGSIQRRFELLEGVTIKLGDEFKNPSNMVLNFKAIGTDPDSALTARETILFYCENLISFDVNGIRWPVAGITQFDASAPNRVDSFNIQAQWIINPLGATTVPSTNFYPYGAMLNADGSLFLNADGSTGLEAG